MEIGNHAPAFGATALAPVALAPAGDYDGAGTLLALRETAGDADRLASRAAARLPDRHDLDRLSVVEAAARGIAALAFAYYAALDFKGAVGLFSRLDLARPDLSVLAEIVSRISIGAFVLLIVWLVLVRLRPLAKSAGLAPRIAAFLGTAMPMAIGLLPPNADLSNAGKLVSSILVLGGTFFAIWILSQLGRSFSIMPEARRLVTAGAYGVVRHPLYLAEFVCCCGVLIRFWSPGAVLLLSIQVAFQMMRIHYEEQVLRRTFSDYADYSRRTWRLIPGLY